MLLRRSQIKFNTPNSEILTLRVVSNTEDGHSSLFFGPVVKALEDSGVNTARIEKIYDTTYRELTKMSRYGLSTLQELCRVSEEDPGTGLQARHILLQLALRLKSHGIFPERYPKSFLMMYLVRLAERRRAKNLFEIPIPDSFQALGLTDDYRILEEEEVYIRAKGQTVTGDVLIYRDPIIHIGDMQKAKALTDKTIGERLSKCTDGTERLRALTSIDNVVFFSQKDNPPFPSRLSGGDLDGDRFEILSGAENPDSWLHGVKTSPARDYIEEETPKMEQEMKEFDVAELAKFIGQYIRNDCFDELQQIHMRLADERGMKNLDVMNLAHWLSQAVDYAKSGVKVDLYADVIKRENFRVRAAKPDFQRSLEHEMTYDSKEEFYQSQNVLGRIYRSVSSLEFNVPDKISDSELREAIVTDLGLENNPTETIGSELHTALFSYRMYLEAQNISANSETDMFLRKKMDDFPEGQLRGIEEVAMNDLIKRGFIDQVDSTPSMIQDRYELRDPGNRALVEEYYKSNLFKIWQVIDDTLFMFKLLYDLY